MIGILYDKKKFHPVANAAEVEAIFCAPLEMFLKVPLLKLQRPGICLDIIIIYD